MRIAAARASSDDWSSLYSLSYKCMASLLPRLAMVNQQIVINEHLSLSLSLIWPTDPDSLGWSLYPYVEIAQELVSFCEECVGGCILMWRLRRSLYPSESVWELVSLCGDCAGACILL